MTSTGMTGFGSLLKHLRLSTGLTQEMLAERATISAKAVSDLERDPTRLPRLETVTLLADALGLESGQRASLLAAARRATLPIESPPVGQTLSRNWPRPLTALVGRSRDVEVITDLIRRGDVRLLTLTGSGGVGKTRLAVHAAEQAADSFINGIAFVDLAPLVDPDLVITTVAQQLGLGEQGETPIREHLAAYLRSKSVLLLLDNFEHVIAARETVLQLLEECPHLIMMVTSRTALRLRGEHLYVVEPLTVPDVTSSGYTFRDSTAVELFMQRVRALGRNVPRNPETDEIVAQICLRLDGLPLAIELAAAWSTVLPPSALLARLDLSLPPLNGRLHDLPARQQTMRDAIAWSYELLASEEKSLFRSLSVFVSGYTLDAAEAIGSKTDTVSPVLQGIAGLIDKSLLRMTTQADGESRLSALETIREFGLEQLELHGELQSGCSRHAAYYLELVERAEAQLTGRDQLAWMVQLEREHDNIRAALRWTQDTGEALVGQRLGGALWRFWSARGYLTEGRQRLRDAVQLSVVKAPGSHGVRLKALLGATMLAIDQGDLDDAQVLCAEGVALARSQGMHRGVATMLSAQGMISRQKGRYSEAMRSYEEALDLAQEQDAAELLTGLATTVSLMGDQVRAAKLYGKAIPLLRDAGNTRGLAIVLGLQSLQVSVAGDYERAESLGREALTMFEAVGDSGGMAGVLFALGQVAQIRGHYDAATTLYEKCRALRQERGDSRGVASSLIALACTALNQDDLLGARALLVDALKLLRQHDDRWKSALAFTVLGHVELAEDEVGRAHTCLAESAVLFLEIGNTIYLPWCVEGLASVAVKQNRTELAAELCGARDALLKKLGSTVPALDPRGYERTVDALRSAMGDEAFAEMSLRGVASPLDVIIADWSGSN